MHLTPPLPGAADPLVRRVLILKADRQFAARIATVTADVFPHAEIVITQYVAHAADELARAPFDLLVTGLIMMDGDTCGLIRECAAVPCLARRVLIVTGRANPWLFKLLHELPIDGAFDSRKEAADELAASLRSVMRGTRSFSESFSCFACPEEQPFPDIFNLLTHAEVLILTVVGDGCDRLTAADRLDLALSTINFYCEELHRKLGVRHDRDLIRIAISGGLVCYEHPHIVRLGFEVLVERYEQAQRRKRVRPRFIAALCANRMTCRREGAGKSAAPFEKAS